MTRTPTSEQAEVIRLASGPARVLAGAGSGKTHTMTELVSYRVDEHLRRLGGTAPERILALTFTVKAADEMRSRLLSRIGARALKLTVSNFHSYALDIVRENATSLGLTTEAPVLRRGRAWLMVLDVLAREKLTLHRLDLADPARVADRVLTLLSRAKNDLVTLESLRERTKLDLDLARQLGSDVAVFEERMDLVELALRFEAERGRRGLLRYEDMIDLGASILESTTAGAPYRGRYELLVVDEFQDTNPAQLRFVELLAGGDLSKVVVIGDDLQSIYNFTGASIRNIQRFEETANLPIGSRTYPLTVNFRSGTRILDFANHIAVAVHPEDSPDEPKLLRPREDAPFGEVSAFVGTTDREEANGISDRIGKLLSAGAPPSSCAVLLRRWSQASAVLAALTRDGIPCEIVEGGDLLTRPEVRFVSDHLRLLAEPGGARESLLRLLSRAPVLLDPNDVRAVFTAPEGPEAALRAPDVVPGLSLDGVRRLERFSHTLARLEEELASSDSLGAFVERTVEITGIGHELRSSPEQEAKLALQFLGLFRDVAAEFGESRFISEFLRYLEVSASSRSSESVSPASEETNSVRITTIHRSKGLEFDHVFVPGLSAKLFPEERSQDSAMETATALPPPLRLNPDPESVEAYNDLDAAALRAALAHATREEEGRLFYVACTRARRTLTLSRAHFYRDNVRPKPAGDFWKLLLLAPDACAVAVSPEPDVPGSNPTLDEETDVGERTTDEWPLLAMADGADAEIASGLEIEDWESELSDLMRDVAKVPERPRPVHILPPPETHSPSSLMEIETCARRFYYSSVFPVPHASGSLEESQMYGSAIHAWIEDGMKGPPPTSPSDAKYGRGHQKGSGRPASIADFPNSAYGVRAASYPLYEGSGIPTSGPARNVEMAFEIKLDGTVVRGRIDAAFVDEDGTVHLVDWKTGVRRESYAERLQLPLYALAVNRLFGVDPERMRLAYVFVPSGETVEVNCDGAALEDAERRVLRALADIKAGEYEPTPSRYACSHCPVLGVEIEGCPKKVPER